MASVSITAPAVPDEIERRQLRLALVPRVMGAYLGQTFGPGRPDGTAGTGAAVCHILDVKYQPGESCTILYQLDERLVIGTLRWGAGEGEWPQAAGLVAPLGMRAHLFPHDPALPGLAQALDPRAMARALAAALPECREGQARVLRCRVTPLRYRPGRRCTLRLEAWIRDARTGALTFRPVVGKVYHDRAKAASIYRAMQRLSDAAPVHDGRVVSARAAGFHADLPMVVQEQLEGTPLDVLFGRLEGRAAAGNAAAWSGTGRAAEALAALHTAGPVSDRPRSITTELARFGHRAATVARVDAVLGARVAGLATALPAWLGRLEDWGAAVGLVHGDCKPSQFLVGTGSVALLDFDHCGVADPAWDVGTFLATLRQLNVQQSLKARGSAGGQARGTWLAALEQHFLDTYCAASGAGPGLRHRATWYQAVALLRKALRSFARSPWSPSPAGLVAEAWRCVQGLPPPE
jgi:aminoglycoside phosphotransferase (APT) family kinase protein